MLIEVTELHFIKYQTEHDICDIQVCYDMAVSHH